MTAPHEPAGRAIRASVVLRVLPLAAFIIAQMPGAAHAAGDPAAGQASEPVLILQVVLLLLVGRLFGEIMFRLGQPTIIGQILGGIVLGPTVLGSLWPEAQAALFPPSPEQNAMIGGIAQFGILFLLLLAGMETDLGLALRLRKAAITVSASGIAIPFAAGMALGLAMPEHYLPDQGNRLATALFLGTALSISSLKIVTTVVREMGFMRRNIGQLIVAAAVIDDTVGWVIIGITFSLVRSGSIDAMGAMSSILGTALFLGLSLTIGQRVVFEVIRWANDRLHSDLPVMTAVISIMGLMALATSALGVQPVLGAFVAGLLVGRLPILTREIEGHLRGLTTGLFMPVFFGLAGVHADLRLLGNAETLLLAALVVLIASMGKLGGALLAARINNYTWPEALALGFGMNARGSTEVIVATIGLSLGVLDQRLYSVVVAMAVLTTLAMPPSLRWALARLPMRHEEKDRLDREAFEKTSYVSGLERVLIAADASSSGRLATRLAGSFAGARAMPISVMSLEGVPEAPDAAAKAELPDEGASIAERVRSTAQSAAAAARPDAAGEAGVHVNPVAPRNDPVAALASQSGKGHDLLFIGADAPEGDESRYGSANSAMVEAFERAAVLVSARGPLRRDADAAIRILVPVSGDVWSMRGLEFACVIARACDARLAALAIHTQTRATRRARPNEAETTEAIFENVLRIGEHYGVAIRTITEDHRQAELAILSVARRGRYNLIVLGVNRLASDDLAFGPVPDALQDVADRALMFVIAR